jgi:hypothetical protein
MTGQSIAASFKNQPRAGLQFALCSRPDDDPEYIQVHAWAALVHSDYLPDDDAQQFLIHQTPWTWDEIRERRGNRSHLFIAALRVYQLPEPIAIPWNPSHRDRLGAFIPLGGVDIPTNTDRPILDDNTFNKLLKNLKERHVPDPIEQCLERLKEPPKPVVIPDWINTIISLGDRSIEEDTGKSNYQAGTDFENIVKQSLEFLGFTIDDAHKGGAGGLDLFCSAPFPIVGECKAGKKIPDSTAEQLYRIGVRNCGSPDVYKTIAKLIIGPGQPSKYLLDSAKAQSITIMNPETLETLVTLKAQYPGAVNLRELEPILKSGDASKIQDYIEQAQRSIDLRRRVFNTLQTCQAHAPQNSFTPQDLVVPYSMQNPGSSITPNEIESILIELSSPLLGYIGRNHDRYYPIQPLP